MRLCAHIVKCLFFKHCHLLRTDRNTRKHDAMRDGYQSGLQTLSCDTRLAHELTFATKCPNSTMHLQHQRTRTLFCLRGAVLARTLILLLDLLLCEFCRNCIRLVCRVWHNLIDTNRQKVYLHRTWLMVIDGISVVLHLIQTSGTKIYIQSFRSKYIL